MNRGLDPSTADEEGSAVLRIDQPGWAVMSRSDPAMAASSTKPHADWDCRTAGSRNRSGRAKYASVKPSTQSGRHGDGGDRAGAAQDLPDVPDRREALPDRYGAAVHNGRRPRRSRSRRRSERSLARVPVPVWWAESEWDTSHCAQGGGTSDAVLDPGRGGRGHQ